MAFGMKTRNLGFGIAGIIVGTFFALWSINLPRIRMTGGPDWCCNVTLFDTYAFLTVFLIGIAFMTFGSVALFLGREGQSTKLP